MNESMYLQVQTDGTKGPTVEILLIKEYLHVPMAMIYQI